MSRVLLVAADKPLPLCDCRAERSITAHGYTVTTLSGFCVAPHTYYRDAVAGLQLPMKPHQYELSVENCEEDLAALKDYLAQHFSAGEEAELWNLWLGDEAEKLQSYRGACSDFDRETLAQFLNPPSAAGGVGCCRITITM